MRENVMSTTKNVTGNSDRVISHDGGDSKMLRKEIHKELGIQVESSGKGYTSQ